MQNVRVTIRREPFPVVVEAERMCAHALDRDVSLAQQVERDLEGVLSFAALICEAVAEEAFHFELAGPVVPQDVVRREI